MKGDMVTGYRHAGGIHCGSTAMKNLLRFYGSDFEEELLFGLGEGLGFIYVGDQGVPPFVAIHGRTLDLEEVLARRLGISFDEKSFPGSDELWEYSSRMLAEGVPLLAKADIRFLDYFDSGTHFSGHRIVLAGLVGDGNVLVSDSEFRDMQPLPVESLKIAMASTIPPFSAENVVAALGGMPKMPDEEGFIESISSCSKKMLFPGDPFSGIPGMLKACQDMPLWPEMSSTPDFAARFAYQVIEKRGTGGGFFRRLYSRFLIGASKRAAVIGAERLPSEMEHLASKWECFALFLKDISENYLPTRFHEAADMLGEIAILEEKYHKKVVNLFT